MRSTFLPFSRPMIGEEEIEEVVATLRTDWITTGPKVKRFEETFAEYLGATAALAVNSCTAGLHVSLATLGVGPGDAVFTTPMTFCSTVHTIEHVGASPVLVDIDETTANIDTKILQQAIDGIRAGETSGTGWTASTRSSELRPRAIMPVHYAGHPCDLGVLDRLAREQKLLMIEDAAHALPARHGENLIGQARGAGDATAFSFYATKNLATAEGGMITGERDFIDEARSWSLHGMSRDAYSRYAAEGSWFYEVVHAGFKCNMTDIQAALGIHQLEKLEGFQRRREEIVQRYNSALREIDEIETPSSLPDVESAWHLYVIRLNLERLRITRGQFIEELKKRNIGTSVHFIPIHRHRYYKEKYGFEDANLPTATQVYERIISLPLYPKMSDSDVDDVIESVLSVAKESRS
jgi:dTDP-4-amino-4,6-dideoxygalactose transaminase